MSKSQSIARPAGLTLINPHSEALLCEVASDSRADVESKLECARHAARKWRAVPLAKRIAEVERALAHFRENAEQIARDVTQQMGKPIVESRREVETMLARAAAMIALAPDALAPDLVPGKPGFTLRIEHVPLGVVLDIAAWNYPLLIPVNVIVPALIAGNAVLLKHSAKTPLCGEAFERAFANLSVPHLVSALVIDHPATALLIADPRIDHVAFTGSVAGGREVYKSVAASRFIDVGLELGGKDPAYVAEDADLEFAADNVVDGACYNAGQSCCGVERAYVHAKLYDAFLARALHTIRQYKLGDPLDPATTMGPMAGRSGVETIELHVADALQRGARLLAGGQRPAGMQGWFYEPTLLADVPADALVMREESFGPVLPVARVANDAEALALMNDSRYGLTASVWTRDRARAERFAFELEAGTVYQNRCDYLDPTLPWTGVKDSGKGSTLSRYGFHHLTRRKSIHFR
ncbi:MAG: aldehyde dehydrogenase family protein [Planctomycetes bacterium]|nr:aldehyde dehydrogenase family protein [Planctomycetota bacterium]